jgi:hypothetical protein
VSLPTEPIQAVKQWLLAKDQDLGDIEFDLDLDAFPTAHPRCRSAFRNGLLLE